MMPDCSLGRAITRPWGSCGVMSPKEIEPFSGMSPTTSSAFIARIEPAADSGAPRQTEEAVAFRRIFVIAHSGDRVVHAARIHGRVRSQFQGPAPVQNLSRRQDSMRVEPDVRPADRRAQV